MLLQECYRLAGALEPVPGADQLSLKKGIVPNAFQIKHLHQALYYDRFGEYSDPGTGKSLISYLYLIYYWLYGNKTLVVMPQSLMTQYHAELFRSVPDLPLKAHILRHTPKKRQTLYCQWDQQGGPDLLIVSYQIFIKEVGFFVNQYPILICDEAHFLKEPSTKSHACVFDLLHGRKEQRKGLLMTGDPVPSSLKDAYGMIRLITPSIYPTQKAFERFHAIKETLPEKTVLHRDRYGRTRVKRQRVSVVVGYRRKDLLSKNLFKQAARAVKSEVLSLDKPNIIPIDVELYQAHYRLYKKLVNERILEVDGELIDAITAQGIRMHALKLILNPDSYSETHIKNAVIETLEQILDTVNISKNKVIAFAHFQMTIRQLAEQFKHLDPSLIYGESNSDVNSEKFKTEDSCRISFIHPKSGGLGFNFQHVCHNVVMVEPPTTSGDFSQCLSRVHRQGQTNVVNAFVLRVLGTRSMGLVRNLIKKSKESKEVKRERTHYLDPFIYEGFKGKNVLKDVSLLDSMSQEEIKHAELMVKKDTLLDELLDQRHK